MSRIEWNASGQRFFEAGLDRGVLYPRLGPGVPWNGLVSITESTVGGEVEPLYFEGVKYLDLVSSEEFSAQLEAYAAPDEFNAAEGVKQLVPGLFVGNQRRQTFGLCYRTLIGNDLVGESFGYKLHLVYNVTASPSDRKNQTIAATVDPQTRTWTLVTVPPRVSYFKPTAHLVIDSTKAVPIKLATLETMLYGEAQVIPRLPTIAEVVATLEE